MSIPMDPLGMPPMAAPVDPGMAPPVADPAQDPVIQAFLAQLQADPALAEVLEAYLMVLQQDPEIARQVATLAQTPERGGFEAAVALLRDFAAQMGQQTGQPPPDQGGMPPDPAMMGPDPAQMPPQMPPPGAQAPSPPLPEGGMPPQGAMPDPPMPPGPSPGPGAPPPGVSGGMMPQSGPMPPEMQGAGSFEELLAELPPEQARIVRALRPDQREQLLQLYAERGIGVVQALIQQFMAAQGIGQGPQSTPDGRGNNKKEKKEKPKKKRDKSTPTFELDPLPHNKWGERGPSYATCNRHLTRAKEIWRGRDIRIQEDVDLYNLSRARVADLPVGPRAGQTFNSSMGDILHVSSRPFQFIERLTSYCTATGDRKPVTDCPIWADDDDTVNASQAMEDWHNYSREQDEQLSFRSGANGDPRMPLPRLEAGGMALMGGAGFQVRFNPTSKRQPIRTEYIPINRLYPLPGVAMMYSETLTLSEARNAWVELEEYYAKLDNTDNAPDENMKVTIGAWTDVYPDGQGGLWHAIFWVTGGNEYGDKVEDKRAKWIKEPTRIDFGFSPYQYVIWGGAPYYNTEGISDYERFRGMGALTALRRTLKLMDLLWSATATGAIRAVNPAVVRYYLPGTDLKDMKPFDMAAGKTNYGYIGEKAEPLIFSLAGTPDGQHILNALWGEINDMDSPLLKGMGGGAQSGLQQGQQQSAAGSVQVDPIIDALERMYQLQNTLRAELLIRKGGEGEIGKIPYPSRPMDDQFDQLWPSFKSLTPEMAKLNGTQNNVKIDRLTLMEKQMLWNMLGQAVQSKMLNARDAMRRMGIPNPQRNLLRILQETAVMDEGALKAMMGAAIMGGDNALFQVGWQQVLMSQQQQGPPAAATPGIPSAVAPTGGPQGSLPAGATQPGMV